MTTDRTITTVAELEALPVGSVVLDHTGDVHQKFPANTIDPERWASILDESRSGADMVAEVAGRFTVLHDPSAPVVPVVSDAAVEAGARAICEPRHRDPDGWPLVGVEGYCGRCLDQSESALMAALPHLGAAQSATREDVAEVLHPGLFSLSDYEYARRFDNRAEARAQHQEAVLADEVDPLFARLTITRGADR